MPGVLCDRENLGTRRQPAGGTVFYFGIDITTTMAAKESEYR